MLNAVFGCSSDHVQSSPPSRSLHCPNQFLQTGVAQSSTVHWIRFNLAYAATQWLGLRDMMYPLRQMQRYEPSVFTQRAFTHG